MTWDRPQRLNTSLELDLYLRFRKEEHAAVELFYEKVSRAQQANSHAIPRPCVLEIVVSCTHDAAGDTWQESNHGRGQVFLPSVLTFLQSVGFRALEKSEVAEMVGKALVPTPVTPLPFPLFVRALLRVKEALYLRTVFCKKCVKQGGRPLSVDKLEKDEARTTFTPVKDWVRYRHDGRLFYHNPKTKETTYSIPEEIRYHLPGEVQQRLTAAYNIAELKRFEGLYALMDVDGDGVVSEDELAVLLKTLGETIEPKQVRWGSR